MHTLGMIFLRLPCYKIGDRTKQQREPFLLAQSRMKSDNLNGLFGSV